MTEERWIGIKELSEYLGVKEVTIRNWIKKGNDLPAHKVGRLWKFKVREIDEWINSGKSEL